MLIGCFVFPVESAKLAEGYERKKSRKVYSCIEPRSKEKNSGLKMSKRVKKACHVRSYIQNLADSCGYSITFSSTDNLGQRSFFPTIKVFQGHKCICIGAYTDPNNTTNLFNTLLAAACLWIGALQNRRVSAFHSSPAVLCLCLSIEGETLLAATQTEMSVTRCAVIRHDASGIEITACLCSDHVKENARVHLANHHRHAAYHHLHVPSKGRNPVGLPTVETHLKRRLHQYVLMDQYFEGNLYFR